MTDEDLAALRDAPPSNYGIEYHRRIGSTNDRARELAEDGAADVAVVADAQTGGRGRRGRSWAGPPGGVYLSVVLAPGLTPEEFPVLTLAAGVGVARAVRALGVDAGIKWPNDVLAARDPAVDRGGPRDDGDHPGDGADDPGDPDAEGKLAGILTERVGDRVVVGIGVNANVDAADLPDRAVSLRDLVGDVDRGAFVTDLLAEFDDCRADPDGILPAWRELARTLGRRVRVDTPDGPVVGTAVDVEYPGTLVVETDGGRVSVSTGDCEHLRPV